MANTYTSNLNLPKPAPADINWDAEINGVTDAMDKAAYLVPICIPFEGQLSVGQLRDGILFPNDFTVKKATVHALDGPTGADLTLTLTKDGSASSAIATLANGSTFQTTAFGTALDYLVGERLGVKVTQIGSTNAGAGVVIWLWGHLKAITTIT